MNYIENGLFSFGDFNSSMLTTKQKEKKARKTEVNKKSTEEKYDLPLTVLLDGGLPVELHGNGSLSKEELLKELAEKTSVAAFMEEWEQFQILRIKNSNRYLIRPDKKSVIQKGIVSGNQVFFYNELHKIDTLWDEDQTATSSITDLIKCIKEKYTIDISLSMHLVGDTYFPVPTCVNASQDFQPPTFPITVHTFICPERIEISEELYDLVNTRDTSQDPPHKQQIDKESIQKCIIHLYPAFNEAIDLILDHQNSITVIFQTETIPTLPKTGKKDTLYPTDAVISLIFTKLQLSPSLFDGRKKVEANEIIQHLQKKYPEYSKERTELQYDKALNLIIPVLKSGKKGCYELLDTESYRKEESIMMNLTVSKSEPKSGSFSWKLPKIPFAVIHKVIQFFWNVYMLHGAEAIALIYFRPENGYSIVIPKQSVSESSVKFERKYIDGFLAMEIHSHGQFPAFWSAEDNADELSHCIYAVVGHFQDFRYDNEHFIARAGTGGYYLPISPTQIIDFPEKAIQFHEWMSFVDIDR